MQIFKLRQQRYILLLCTALMLFFVSGRFRVQAQDVYTLIVNSTLDSANTADLSDVSAMDNGLCELREAIVIVNTAVDVNNDCGFTFIPPLGTDSYIIRFAVNAALPLGEMTIVLDEPLPPITDQVDIGGYENLLPSAASIVRLQSDTAGAGVGLAFTGDSAQSRVTGMVISGFGIGIQVDGVPDVTIGGIDPPTAPLALRNYIYGNTFGIDIRNTGADGTLIGNNSIGVNELGQAVDPVSGASYGNTLDGVIVQLDAQNTSISGASFGEGNVVSNNGRYGINLSTAQTVLIENNVIGVPNETSSNSTYGNDSSGIRVSSATDVTINGNIIGFNGATGITVQGSDGTIISNNNIGTLANTTTAIPNALDGVLINSSDNVQITGSNIFNNGSSGGNGVSVLSSQEVIIEDTLFFNNSGLGIDLDANGVTLNDGAADTDTGANGRQNFPILQSAGFDSLANELTILLNLPVTGTNFDTIFYVNNACDSSGYGEGQDFLTDGGTPYVLSTTGGGTFTDVLSGTYTVGNFISAITIDRTTGNTSEFAQCIPIVDATLLADFIPLNSTVIQGSTVNFSNTSQGAIASVEWYVNGVLVSTNFDYSQVFNTVGTFDIRLEIDNAAGTGPVIQTGQVIVQAPPTATPVPPPTSVPNTSVPPPPVPTDIPTNTPIPPTATLVPTNTLVPPTATLVPTNTLIPPTSTLVPTNTLIPPTATLVPTNTAIPTSTPIIPTATLIPTMTGTPALEVTVVGDADDEMTVFVINVGPNAANNVQVQEFLRSGVEFRASSLGEPICTEVGGIISCRLGTLDGGDETSVNFTVATNGESPDSGITIVTADGVAPTIIDEPFISKIGSPSIAPPGSEITYTIRVVNPTNETASDMVITDQMPDIIDILDAESTAGTLEIDGQDIRLELAELGAGERVTLTIQAFVREDEDASEIINTACVTSSSNPNPNCALMSFLAVDTLPNTGQAAWIMSLMRALLVGIGGAGIIWLGFRRFARKP